jgi:hypothetical protein
MLHPRNLILVDIDWILEAVTFFYQRIYSCIVQMSRVEETAVLEYAAASQVRSEKAFLQNDTYNPSIY